MRSSVWKVRPCTTPTRFSLVAVAGGDSALVAGRRVRVTSAPIPAPRRDGVHRGGSGPVIRRTLPTPALDSLPTDPRTVHVPSVDDRPACPSRRSLRGSDSPRHAARLWLHRRRSEARCRRTWFEYNALGDRGSERRLLPPGVHSARHGGNDVDHSVGGNRGGQLGGQAIHEHVDVRSEPWPRLDQPVAETWHTSVERLDDGSHGIAADVMSAIDAREERDQRAGQDDGGHSGSVGLALNRRARRFRPPRSRGECR
jgi:hypothetical protein